MLIIGLRHRLSIGEVLFKTINCTFLAILALVSLYPFYFVLINSFAHPDAVLRTYFWPKQFFYATYYMVLGNQDLWRAYMISALRLATAVPSMLFVTCAAAFVLSRKEMLLRTPIIFYFFFTMFFSGGLIPYFMTIKAVGLFNTFLVYVIPTLFSVWTMIVMKTSIQSLPIGLVDAALIDGASYGRIYVRIILPLSKAMLAVLGLFSAVGHWNDWFIGMFYIQNPKLVPLQTYLRGLLIGAYSVGVPQKNYHLDEDSRLFEDIMRLRQGWDVSKNYSFQHTYTVIALVPILALYPFLQKYFVKGVLIGSMKG